MEILVRVTLVYFCSLSCVVVVYCYITIVMIAIANIIVIAIVFVTAIGIIIASVSLATVTFELTADRSSIHLDINRLIHCAFYDSINATTHINQTPKS